ncbi:MAG TPA: conjugal transfer protein [Mycobacteriales bacterium]|nr:conjugal transfer protein [Mycobacteriales bacterium]
MAAYLQAGAGREDVLRPFLVDVPQLPRTPAGHWYAARTAVVDAVWLRPGYWAVTVAVEVMTVGPRGYTPVGLRCYRVSVQASSDQPAAGRSGADTGVDAPSYVATGLPALVAAPTRARSWPLARATAPLPAESPPAQTAARFLSAYLAGQGELSRYTAPGTVLGAVTPAPFADISVEQVTPAGQVDTARAAALEAIPADGDRLEVLAEVSAADAGGAVQQLTYGLRLTGRGGRWEVSAVDQALPLESPPPGPAATSPTNQPGTSPSAAASSPPASSPPGTPAPGR